MYAFLLLLGAVITAAGLGIVASGVSIQEHTFEAANTLPAMIAVIGGCILIGLSFVVRALQRVERALTARPMPRPVRPGEIGNAGTLAGQSIEPARIPLPPKPKAPPTYPQPIPAGARPAPVAAKAAEGPREPVPPVVDESDVSLLPKAPSLPDEEKGTVNHGVAGRANGSLQVKTAPRLGVSARPVHKPLQADDSIFSTLWPRAAPAPEVNRATAAPVQVTPPSSPAQPANGREPTPHAAPAEVRQEASAAVSILKSGVVEGMAYTLYSDGSIEAQLPEGTVRFGSITELRNHIEKNA
jgi:hypothetical protein